MKLRLIDNEGFQWIWGEGETLKELGESCLRSLTDQEAKAFESTLDHSPLEDCALEEIPELLAGESQKGGTFPFHGVWLSIEYEGERPEPFYPDSIDLYEPRTA